MRKIHNFKNKVLSIIIIKLILINIQLLFRMETGQVPLVNTAAYLAKSVIYNNRERFSASLIVSGWDKLKGGQVSKQFKIMLLLSDWLHFYQFKVYVVPLSGMVVRKNIHISGSGSVYAMGYLDANYKPGLSKNECLELVKNAVALAIARDGSSGGCIRYAIVTEKGVERNVILNDAVTRFYEI